LKESPKRSLAASALEAAALLIAFYLFTDILLHPFRIKDDCAYYLQLGMLVLNGFNPFVDLIDANPPLIMYLNVLPALISRATSINPIPVFQITVLAFALVSSVSIRRILIQAGEDRVRIAISIFVWALFTALLYTRLDFGQREHLFLIFFCPYFVIRVLKTEGASVPDHTAVIWGFASGMVSCLKPTFLLVPLCLECSLAVRAGSLRNVFRLETAALACAGIVHGLYFVLMPREARDELIWRWLPFVAKGYKAFHGTFYHLLARKDFIFSLLFMISGVFVKCVPGDRISAMALPAASACLGGILSYLIHHTGYSYQLIVADGFAVIIASIWAIYPLNWAISKLPLASVDPKHLHRTVQAMSLLGFLLILLNFEFRIATRGPAFYELNGIYRIVEKYSKENDKVVFISTDVSDSFPLITALKRFPGSRFLSFSWVAMLYADRNQKNEASLYRTDPKMIPEERQLISEMEEDIKLNKPRLILARCTTGSVGCSPNFNIFDYLTAIGFVRRTASEYTDLGAFSGFRVFIKKPHLGPRYRFIADHGGDLLARRW
jgi:hypothetical protein